MPTIRLPLLITGSLRTCSFSMCRTALPRSSSSRQQWMPGVITSRAIARPASKLSCANPLQTMSRSVTISISRSFSPIGMAPMSCSRINFASSVTGVSGLTQSTPLCIASLTFMAGLHCGIVFPRESWLKIRQRLDFGKPGVYILLGYVSEEDDLPTLYIGQGDVVRTRIDTHVQTKDFWNKAVVFVSSASGGGLNRAHATWLEHALIRRAIAAKQSHLENGTEPQEPAMSEAERADMQAFLREMLQILPLVGLNAFEFPRPVAEPMVKPSDASQVKAAPGELDTIVVPAQKDGFERVFLGQDAWWAIRISGGMIPKIKYIAAYQSAPVSAITHAAPVARIEPHGDKIGRAHV